MKDLTVTRMRSSTVPPLLLEIHSPFETDGTEYTELESGVTIGSILANYDLSSQPKLIVYNTQPLLEEEWDTTVLQDGDTLSIIAQPGLWWFIPMIVMMVVSVAVAAYSLYMILTMDSPDPGERGDSANYSVAYRGNRRRPGQPVPVLYGEMRVFPDLSGQYSVNRDNEQLMYQIFDITMGEIEDLDVSEVFYEDTPLTSFNDYQFEQIPPGDYSRLYPSNVIVSSEVSNIELPDDSWSAEYVTNPIGTVVTKVQVDLLAPNGIYKVDDKGRKRAHTEVIFVEIRSIDLNPPYDVWVRKFYNFRGHKEKRLKTVHFWDLPEDRYEVRFRRLRNPPPWAEYSTDLAVTGLRAVEPDITITETTRVALYIRASKQLGNATLSKFSVKAKRKLPIWSGSAWTVPTFTNAAAWAFSDVVRADYGADLADEFLDISTMFALAQTGVTWNGIYDSKNTVWQALNEIARPFNGRAVQLPGGIYSIKRDLEAQAPKMMFTMRNIVNGSFAMSQTPFFTEDKNFVRVTFKNVLEDYRETSIDCVPEGVVANKPHEVRLRGVTEEEYAYAIGIRMAQENRYRRKQISFSTGLEGLCISYMDAILVGHYMLGLEQSVPSISGEIASVSGNQTLTVRENVGDLQAQGALSVYIKDIDGSPYGPASCTISSDYVIQLASPAPAELFVFGDDHAGPLFCIGLTSDLMMECKVTAMEQTGEHVIKVDAVVDDPRVYGNTGSPGYTPIDPPEDIKPTVQNLQATLYGEGDAIYASVTWDGANADYYIVDTSEDGGIEYGEVGTPTESNITINLPLINPVYIRVRGMSLFEGLPAIAIVNPLTWEVSYPGIYGLQPLYPFNSYKCGVTWDKLPVDTYARIKFLCNGLVVKTVDVDTSVSFVEVNRDEVMATQARTFLGTAYPAANCRTVVCQMVGIVKQNDVWIEDTNYSELTQTNDPAGLPLDLETNVSGENLSVDFNWPEVHDGNVFVCVDTAPGFTPDATTMIHFGDSSVFTVVGKLVHGGLGSPTQYWGTVAVCDLWGPDNLQWYPEFTFWTTDVVPPIEEDMLHPDLSARLDLIDRIPVVGSQVADGAVGEIDELQADVGALEGYFIGGVLQIPYGGTASTTATGTGETVLATGPVISLGDGTTAITQALADATTKLATTAWVHAQGYSGDPDFGDIPDRLAAAEADIDVLEGYFTAGVLDIIHGGTSSSTATGSGETVLATSPTLGGIPLSSAPAVGDNSTRIATTAWVKSQGYVFDPAISDLPARMDAAEADIDVLESYFTAGVLQVIHGGTGVTVSTGTGEVVLSNSPDFDGNATATTQSTSNSSTRIATTAFVKNQGYATDVDLSSLEGRVTTNEGDIGTLEGYFIADVLQVIHGGTGVTSKTGSGSVVLSASPTLSGTPKSSAPSLSDNTTRIATTAFVKGQNYADSTDLSGLQSQIDDNRTDLDVIESHFVTGVLQVEHGGTGVTVSTGTGEVVLSNSPDFDGNATATTQSTSDSSTRIATTAFVKAQGYLSGGDLGDLETRMGIAEGDIDTLESYFIAGVLQVAYGGTGQSLSTGSGPVVLRSSPTVYLGSGSTMSTRPLGDNTTRVANTAFVQQEIADQSFDPSGLQSQLDHNHGDIEAIAGWFGGYDGPNFILEVAHGGTGVTLSTGTGEVVLSNSPDLDGNATATTQSSTNDSTRIATTAFVHNVVDSGAFDPSGLQSQIDTNRTDLDVIEGHFNGGVLEVVHGGTGVTSKTGSSKVVLSSSPTLTGTPDAPTASIGTNDTQIATTAFVHNLVNAADPSAFPSYAWQSQPTITTSWQIMGGTIYATPSKAGVYFRISWGFQYYPSAGGSGSPFHRANLHVNNASTDEVLLSREWDGGKWTVEGQTKTRLWYVGTTDAIAVELRARCESGSNFIDTFLIEVQEVPLL